MTGLLAYSGITAKIQAMESKLIQEDRAEGNGFSGFGAPGAGIPEAAARL